MENKDDKIAYPQAGLGFVSTSEGLKRADGTKPGEMPRGCSDCNREQGRSSDSVVLKTELPLIDPSGEGAMGIRTAVQVVIDYCPYCGRVYDVRCSASA